MASKILELPVELLFEIFEYIRDNVEDLKSVARVTPCFYALAVDHIWDRADQDHRYRIFMWACASGSPRAVRRLLDLGFTANVDFQLRYQTSLDYLTPDFYLKLPPPSPGLVEAGSITWDACIPDMDDYHNPAAPLSGPSKAHFWMPLHVAAHHGHAHIVEILLRHGAWVDATSMNYSKRARPVLPCNILTDLGRPTPLHVALCNLHEDVAQVLIAQGGASMYVDHLGFRAQRAHYPNRDSINALHLCAS